MKEVPDRAPFEEVHRAAVAAIDLLRQLAVEQGGVEPPLPRDDMAVGFLGRTHFSHWPGPNGCPEWLLEAWRRCDYPVDHPHAPRRTVPIGRDRLLEQLRDEVESPFPRWAAKLVMCAELSAAYLDGTLTPAEILAAYPARWTMPVRERFEYGRLRRAYERELQAHLKASLGADTDAWLRLLTVVDQDCAPDTDGPSAFLGWPELVKRSQDIDAADPERFVPAKDLTSKKVEDLLFYARWWWPAGEVLRRCDADTLDVLIPVLPAGTRLALARYTVALRHGTPREVLEHLLRSDDREALRAVAEGIDLTPRTALRLLTVGDPDIHLAVLGVHFYIHAEEHVAALTDPAVPLAPFVDRIPWNALPDCLHAIEPELIEAAFASSHQAKFKMPEQLTGCLNLLRQGGPARLAALLASGRVSPGAARICRTALAAPDPLAALEARVERELTTPKLVSRLRRLGSRAGSDQADRLMRIFSRLDWDLLEVEHAREPFRFWPQMVNRQDTPLDVAARHTDAIETDHRRHRPETDRPEVARVLVRSGLSFSANPDAANLQLEDLLTTEVISTDDLLHDAGLGPCVLRYLAEARLRPDAPPQAVEAVDKLAELVRTHLPATDDEAWQRLYTRLAGLDPSGPERGTIHDILTTA
ncbi:hypothetical protein NGF19_21700 [Streptomyces sp. RY43-2]|uniref:PE-PGRS family protein n=1 Tax=Streptomyces macrolidinus TaxID=2952607 RepID=A0ABT0ZIF4_9ACTN|nr:hypothetical protein [Streptomyces macrolidinus]MCN9243365.1 hypothetical protein [Streptomyces macrolidinus]